MSDQTIKKHNIISLVEFTQKHVRDQKILRNVIKNLVDIINKLDEYVSTNKALEVSGWFKDYVYGNLHYLFYYAKIKDDTEFIRELEKIKFIKQEGVMGELARKIEQKGIAKGRTEGIAEGKKEVVISMLEKGYEPPTIADLTKLTLEEIQQINQQIQQNIIS